MSPSNKVKKERVVVICPGRGTYNKDELGYLKRLHADKTEIVDLIDEYRVTQDQVPIADLDGAQKFSMAKHTAGENASALIYACALSDYLSIDQDNYDIVGVTGNSMGWYIALAVAGALNRQSSIKLINTMGSMMTDGIIGGQIIYPVMDESWNLHPDHDSQIANWLSQVNSVKGSEVYVSIYLGGYIVFGGNLIGLKALEEILPPIDERYPLNLFNHAAFHTPLLEEISQIAKSQLSVELFNEPEIPLIDGLGNIWQPYSTDIRQLYEYTLGAQVVEPYNFSKAIEVAIKEFAPDKLIILGPGATLGGATAQCLINNRWLGFENKDDFISHQKQEPFILSMGMEEQRNLATNKS